MHGHHHHLPSPQERSSQAIRVTLIGSAIDLALGLLKLFVGWVINSQALVVDGLHSLSDLLTDGIVVLVAKMSHEEPDDAHPYGHARFETLGTVILGALLMAIAGALVYDSIIRLVHEQLTLEHGFIGVGVALLSVVSKEWIYRYTLKVGKALNSPLLIANAWHSRSDALSSVVVVVGLLGVIAGFPILDLIAAMLVALLIGKIGWDLTWNSVQQLVDTALPTETVEAIESKIRTVSGVLDVHDLRSRFLGPHAAIDVHIQVDPTISVSEGHQIGEWVEALIKKEFSEITDVVFHIDSMPHKQDLHFQSEHKARLPLRPEVESELFDAWRHLLPIESVEHLNLHYHDNAIDVVVFLAEPWASNVHLTQLKLAANDILWLREVRVWRHC